MPYILHKPTRQLSPIVFNSPHSGAKYPDDLLQKTILDIKTLRSSEDAFVDELFSSAPNHGALLMAAKYPRAYVDLNRSPKELDPALIVNAPNGIVNPRVEAGLGVIPRVVAKGRAIQSGKMEYSEAQDRIKRCHKPYHDALTAILTTTKKQFGCSLLIDCHSMPSDSLEIAPYIKSQKPDIIIGDRFGSSCPSWISNLVVTKFMDAGFVVARNIPYAGGYITQKYGKPSSDIYALQIEINRELYMDEGNIETHSGMDRLKPIFSEIIRNIIQSFPANLDIAAE